MAVNDHFQCAGGAFLEKMDLVNLRGATRRSRFPTLRQISATLQSSRRDLSIDTLSTFSTSRVLRIDADVLLLGDRDLG